MDEIIGRLAAVVPDHSKIVLFGSRARGDQRVTSDIDVLVIEPAVDDPIAESVRLRRALNGLRVCRLTSSFSRETKLTVEPLCEGPS